MPLDPPEPPFGVLASSAASFGHLSTLCLTYKLYLCPFHVILNLMIQLLSLWSLKSKVDTGLKLLRYCGDTSPNTEMFRAPREVRR